MASTHISSFSDDGEYFAHSSSDGTLRIFECATGILKQEYSSSSHLSATTSSLTWSRHRKESSSPPKAKKKRLSKSYDEEHFEDGLKLIALGTTAGTVNLYSFAKGLLHTELTGGHVSRVNNACWHLSKPELFTCSEDQTVVHWDLKKGKVRHKWKCDTSSIYSVCHCAEQRLLTASNNIKLWDIETRTLLQTFTGHSSPIFQLEPVWQGPESDDANYVLSAAVDDRHISVWNCSESVKDKNSIASFSVPDEPVSMSLSKPSSLSQELVLAVITRKGIVYIFQHILNGKKKKPLVSKVTVKAVMGGSGDASDKSDVPILASCLIPGNVTVACGNPVQPIFEKVVYDTSKPEVVISLMAPAKTLVKDEYSQVKRPEISKHMTTLIPADSQPLTATRNKDKNRLRRTSVSELTVEERLAAMSTDTPSEVNVKQPPVANTLSRLLQQGLLSGDSKILTGVFQETNETIVRNTIKKLPVSCIIPLVKEIEKGMTGHSQHAWSLSRWTSSLISCHTSYILSVPEIIATMNKLYQTLISRQKFYPQMLQLKGRLDLVKQERHLREEGEDTTTEPLLVYQDESDSSDSDSMVIDGTALESDENWEDISDMES
ncbi:WD repeat-containing protein 43-like isoform X2 [Physella acuta]|uniref:WD repeat-containing protein 43-like isoform X2 n=1 Tax=Physella acuta TaxID=109671 RepID=UPI0027DB37D0|nr:WD repeat-containing protein 43-like isoform X2 [Physella acuta]